MHQVENTASLLRSLQEHGWTVRRQERVEDSLFAEVVCPDAPLSARMLVRGNSVKVTVEFPVRAQRSLGRHETMTFLGWLAQMLPDDIRPRLLLDGQQVCGVALSQSVTPLGVQDVGQAATRLGDLGKALPAEWGDFEQFVAGFSSSAGQARGFRPPVVPDVDSEEADAGPATDGGA